ncbi:transporter substrate-binding domain-containing protein [Phyllobacterium sp. UNC302MFCol5.2]|uniref:substrate-binding periplasmic protein n=1 Tax=Phyllobacterium sp. UNC302MFCol5.2 TaxID=1449065 RepID=UPI0004828984|nr:transporter substrate-binding domain-containing protein [Phyllobacterium sp. UNC302MFCol5.2]
MKMIKILSAAAVILTSASVLTVSNAYADEVVKVGIDAAYKPFAYVDTNGELAGLEVDLTKAVCAEAKLNCQITNVPWDGIWTALETGTIDMIGTTVTETGPRLEKYDATRIIYKVGYAYLVPESADISKGIEGLKGQSIGTIVGTQSYYDFIKATLGNDTQIQGYDSPDAAVLDLDAGRIAAFQNDNLQLQQQFVSTGKYKLVAEPSFDKRFVGEGRGWFFRKGSKELVAKIDKGLDTVIASGKLNELGQKYLKTNLTSQ